MRGSVLHVERRRFVLAVVVESDLVQTLVQGAAIGDVHFLKPAANREHRQAGGDRLRDQRKRRSIPTWIMQCSRLAGRASVTMGFDIRGTPREHQAVAHLEQCRQIEFGAKRRYQHRQRIGACRDGIDVFLADHVEVVVSTEPAIGRNSDDGQARHV